MHPVPFGEALRVWTRIGLTSFGGPAGQVALMHKELVERRRWLDEASFLHALNYCMLLPGPEAQQLATYIGWLIHRWPGGLLAGGLFVLPGAVAVLGLSAIYVAFGEVALVRDIFFGLKAAVLSIVVEALLRVGRRSLKTRVQRGIAALSFAAIFALGIPFPALVVAAGLLGAALGARGLLGGGAAAGPAAGGGETVLDRLRAEGRLAHTAPSARRSLLAAVLGLGIWWGPLLLLQDRRTLWELGLLFSKAAMVTFGGAYAVLGYVRQEAVAHHGWLEPADMLNGLALAETTPGPLVLVLEFVGFVAAFRNPDGGGAWVAGLGGAGVALWATFAPCFTWIFVGAPWVEALRGRPALDGALAAIAAAVVGVILDLSLRFAAHVLFAEVGVWGALPLPTWSSLDPAALALSVVAVLATFRLKLSMGWTLALCGALGLVVGALG